MSGRSHRFRGWCIVALLAGYSTLIVGEENPKISRVHLPDPVKGGGSRIVLPYTASDAAIVERGGLVHTNQLFSDGKGFIGFVDQLRTLCSAHGVDLSSVVKLNLYVKPGDHSLSDGILDEIKEAWPGEDAPAVTAIESTLPDGARMAGDAVFRIDDSGSKDIDRTIGETAVMPAERDILYVSGRAAREGDLAEATGSTMEQLLQVIGELGSDAADVIQVKAFLQPMSDWKRARSAIESVFGDAPVPPIVLAEWTSSLPTEIEMIAAAPAVMETDETVSYFTPEGDKASPVFSRVARVHSNRLIYIGGIYGMKNETPFEELKRVFARLSDLSDVSGSDLEHLAKATYYVSDEELSRELNKIRPHIYDPKRPPAASKVAVLKAGPQGAGLLMDFIAVPKR